MHPQHSQRLAVHARDLLFEGVLCDVPLKLHCACKDAVCRERNRAQHDLLGQLESQQSVMFALLGYLVQNDLGNGTVLAQLFEALVDSLFRRKLHQDVLIGEDDSYVIALKGVSVDEGFGRERTSKIDIFDLFRSDVLSLTQLVDVLLPVD